MHSYSPTAARAVPQHRRRAGGFTLVELLVVIGVIALVMGILLPSLSKARAAANRIACMSNVRQIGTAILMYCNDNRDWFPTCAYGSNGLSHLQMDYDWIFWEANRNLDDSATAKYLAASGEALKRLYRCPVDTFDGRVTNIGLLSGQGPYLYSYHMNEALAVNFSSGAVSQKRCQWRATSRKIMLAEPIVDKEAVWGWSLLNTTRHGIANSTVTTGKMGINASAAFIDGHVEGVDDSVTYTAFHYQPDAQ